MYCSRCCEKPYCGSVCQAQNWGSHKTECKKKEMGPGPGPGPVPVAPISGPLDKLRAKYESLVWYARKAPRGHLSYAAMPAAQRKAVYYGMARVEELYPAEVAKLSGVEGDWAHGFNSGCLASFRLALELIDKLREEGADEARLAEVIESTLRDFPETDS